MLYCRTSYVIDNKCLVYPGNHGKWNIFLIALAYFIFLIRAIFTLELWRGKLLAIFLLLKWVGERGKMYHTSGNSASRENQRTGAWRLKYPVPLRSICRPGLEKPALYSWPALQRYKGFLSSGLSIWHLVQELNSLNKVKSISLIIIGQIMMLLLMLSSPSLLK